MERNRLRSLDENRNKKIHKGKLKIDEAMHDEFNIDKQLLLNENF